MTLALHGKSRARQCALILAAMAAVAIAVVAGGGLRASNAAMNDKPDLVATKTHSGTLAVGATFKWKIEVRNIGKAVASFGSSYVVFRDDLPANSNYSALLKSNQGMDSTEFDQLVCGIYLGSAPKYIQCKPRSSSAVDIPPGTGFDLEITASPFVIGDQTNPIGTGICMVDPYDALWTESDETNNACSDTITASSSRSVRVVKVVSGAGAPAITFDGTITGTTTSLTWQTTGPGQDTKSNVAPETLAVKETTALSTPWSFGGYDVVPGTTTDCSAATFSGDQATGATVPATGDQTVCVKNVYTPPTPLVTLAKSHTGSGSYAPGDTFDWEIAVSVADAETIAAATITDDLPDAFTVNSVTVSDPHNDPDKLTCTAVLDPVNCTLAAGAAIGATYTITVNVTVNSGATCGTVTNYAALGTQTPVSDAVTILCGGDPTVEKSDATLIDGKLHWTITISNPAEFPQDVPVSDSDSGATAAGSTCANSVSGAGPWTCTAPANGAATITVETTLPVNPDICLDYTVTNTASIPGATHAGSSDSGTYLVGAIPSASCLAVKKENTANGSWEITFTNRGLIATGVSFTDTYTPANLDTIISVSGAGASCTGTGNARECTVDLPPGETVVTVTTTALSPACQSQTAANAVAATFDGVAVPAPAGGSLSASFALAGELSLCPGTIKITKIDHTTSATPGRPSEWTIVLSGPTGQVLAALVNTGETPKETVFEISAAAAGQYSIAEAQAGPAVCPTAPGSAASWGTALSQSPLQLEPGGTIEFTVTNFPCEAVAGRGALVVEKVEDVNGSGARDPGESLIEWQVQVTGPEPGFEDGKSITLTGGQWSLGGLVAGFYTVREATGAAGYAPAGPTMLVVEVPNGGEAVARFHNQPQATVKAAKTEIFLAGSAPGQGWKMNITGCGYSDTKTTGPDGSATWTGLPLCDYTVAEDPSSKDGYFPAGPTSVSVKAAEAGTTYTVAFSNYRETSIPACTVGCEAVSPATPSAAPTAVPSPVPTTSPPSPAPAAPSPAAPAAPAPIETVAGAVAPGPGNPVASARATPIAPDAGSGLAASGAGELAMLPLGMAVAVAGFAIAFSSRRRGHRQ